MMYELKPLGNFVELTQGLAINAGTAHLVSDIKETISETYLIYGINLGL